MTLSNVSQLGSPVDVSFLIRNSGPSRIPNIQLDIMWPLNSTLTGENYYFYITSIRVLLALLMIFTLHFNITHACSYTHNACIIPHCTIQSTGAATVICNDKYINPLRLEGDLSDNQEGQEGGDPTVSMGSGRRRKRSTVKRTLRNKRQEAPAEQDLTEHRSLVNS